MFNRESWLTITESVVESAYFTTDSTADLVIISLWVRVFRVVHFEGCTHLTDLPSADYCNSRPFPVGLWDRQVNIKHVEGSHGDWKTWKTKMVMEKSWNMKNWPKVMEFCDQS